MCEVAVGRRDSKEVMMCVRVSNAEQWGIHTVRDLGRLGTRKVRVRVGLAPTPLRRLIPLAPGERLRRQDTHYDRQRRALAQANIFSDVAQTDLTSRGSLDGVLPARMIPRLLEHPGVEAVTVLDIEGRRRSSKKPPSATLGWYAVSARIVIEVEGRPSRTQTYEDRITILMATGPEVAASEFERKYRREEKPYLNDRGELVRWKLESVLEVQELLVEKIDPGGTEVFSVMRSRRTRR